MTTPHFLSRRPLALAGSLALVCLALVPQQAAPPLYMPRTMHAAYENGTRSMDGRPGAAYWQNRARYAIALSVLPPDRTVRGTEQVTYWNNSPNTLHSLVIKLFLNIHRPGAPRNGGASLDYLTTGIHIDAFAVNDVPTPWPDEPQYFTWQPATLPSPLAPHDSVRLSFDWHYEISREAGREGMIDSTTYFLAYFYPRVAVYDDYNGWDRMDFTDQQEFYSDFNDYSVLIRAPANYVVWGTGTLANAGDVLQPDALRRFNSSFASDTTVHVATLQDMQSGRVTAQSAVNTWQFVANNVPDVAFAISDHYVWDAASVIVDDATGRRASTQAAYNDTAADYHHMAQFARHALNWLSHDWPGVPYPFEKTTVVQGPAGMEYPMMANDESYADTTFARFVAEHEIAHSYFPFYMGVNETRYGFMDEGWATTFEYLINQQDMGPRRAADFYKQFRVNGWAHDPSPLEDLPIITPADVLKGVAYGNNAYGKASLGYLAVKDLLGDDMFRKCLQAFIERWHGKHPTPWDFFNTFNDVSGQDLNWFWNNWYFSNGYVDLATGGMKKTGSNYVLEVRNIGGLVAPFDLTVGYTDGTEVRLHQTPAVWKADQATASVTVPAEKQIHSIHIETGIWVDADSSGNLVLLVEQPKDR